MAVASAGTLWHVARSACPTGVAHARPVRAGAATGAAVERRGVARPDCARCTTPALLALAGTCRRDAFAVAVAIGRTHARLACAPAVAVEAHAAASHARAATRARQLREACATAGWAAAWALGVDRAIDAAVAFVAHALAADAFAATRAVRRAHRLVAHAAGPSAKAYTCRAPSLAATVRPARRIVRHHRVAVRRTEALTRKASARTIEELRGLSRWAAWCQPPAAVLASKRREAGAPTLMARAVARAGDAGGGLARAGKAGASGTAVALIAQAPLSRAQAAAGAALWARCERAVIATPTIGALTGAVHAGAMAGAVGGTGGLVARRTAEALVAHARPRHAPPIHARRAVSHVALDARPASEAVADSALAGAAPGAFGGASDARGRVERPKRPPRRRVRRRREE